MYKRQIQNTIFNLPILIITLCKVLQQPVNPLLVTEADGSQWLYVLDRSHVVKLDADGKAVGRFDLKLKKQGQVSYLRTAVDDRGSRWFAAGQMGGASVYVFNSKWQQQFSFPAIEILDCFTPDELFG